MSGRPYRWIILFLGLLAYSTSHLARWSYSGVAMALSLDLGLSKTALGLLGSSFFYPYALSQVPWGIATDRRGGRLTVSVGILGSAALLIFFAGSISFKEAVGWRLLLGIMAASSFVPLASLMARWFAPRERGMANSVYYALGGGGGEAAAFLLLPVMSLYLNEGRAFMGFSGWRGAVVLVAVIVGLIGIICLIGLRSAPSAAHAGAEATGRGAGADSVQDGPARGSYREVLMSPLLWMYALVFSGGIVALRLIPGWLPIFAADVYIVRLGKTPDQAVLMGGMTAAAYAVGRIVGTPIVGRLSDRLLHRAGITRGLVCGVGMAVAGSLFILFSWGIASPGFLAAVAFSIGVSINTFPLINAAVSETWGARRAGFSLGVVNTLGQLAGAVSLAASGFIGVTLNPDPGNSLTEYDGIWYLGFAFCLLASIGGLMAHRLTSRDGRSHSRRGGSWA